MQDREAVIVILGDIPAPAIRDFLRVVNLEKQAAATCHPGPGQGQVSQEYRPVHGGHGPMHVNPVRDAHARLDLMNDRLDAIADNVQATLRDFGTQLNNVIRAMDARFLDKPTCAAPKPAAKKPTPKKK